MITYLSTSLSTHHLNSFFHFSVHHLWPPSLHSHGHAPPPTHTPPHHLTPFSHFPHFPHFPLLFCHSLQSSKPVGMVLKRGSWESVADLVGHSTSSLCCKFCPVVLSSSSSNSSSGSNDSSGSSSSSGSGSGSASSSSSSSSGTSGNSSSAGASAGTSAGPSGGRASKKGAYGSGGPGTRASGAPSCCVALGDQQGVVSQ